MTATGPSCRWKRVLVLAVLFFDNILQSCAFQVIGVTAGVDVSGARPARQEINQLAQSGPAFDLFMLALQAFQNIDQSDPLSYYRIAGMYR